MSRGTAMSTMKIGRRLRARSASSTIARVMMALGSRSRRPRCRHRAGACRLVEADREAPELGRQFACAVDAAVRDDHPTAVRVQVPRGEGDRLAGATISAVRFSKLAKTVFASAHRGVGDRHGVAPISVSVRTRLLTENAAWNRRFSTGPVVPASRRDAVGVLQLAEDLRLAEHQRVEARATENTCDGGMSRVPVQAVVDAGAELVVALCSQSPRSASPCSVAQ